MKPLHDESGQMLIMVALSLAVLLGFMAFATDVGTLFHAKRQLQIAADAAATAGALDLNYDESSTQVRADAISAALANGVKQAAYVTVHTPPVDGYHQSAGYIEVVVTEPRPTFFMNFFGLDSVNVSARAVAGSPSAAATCIYIMDTTASNALELHGNGSVYAPGCGVYINSDALDAYNFHDGGDSMTASFVDVVGGTSGSSAPTPATNGVTPRKDPFDHLDNATAVPPTCTNTYVTPPSGTTIDAGGGVDCFTGSNPDISGYTLQNGLFYFENGVTAAAHAATTVNNGTIEVAQGAFNQSTESNLNITAPTSGTYNGIAVLIPTSNTYYTPTGKNQLQLQFGSSNETLDGFIVAPNAQVTLHDQGGGVVATGFVVDSIYDNSSIRIPSYNVANSKTTPLRVVSLVE